MTARCAGLTWISIHALLAESDNQTDAKREPKGHFYPRSPCGERRGSKAGVGGLENFYPRSPCGERRAEIRAEMKAEMISIHALLAESDKRILSPPPQIPYFYPRSPCGERRKVSANAFSLSVFLSTLSLRRATAAFFAAAPPKNNFYPRSPCGERQQAAHALFNAVNISIHALLAESDLYTAEGNGVVVLFLSTLSLRRATGSGTYFLWGE